MAPKFSNEVFQNRALAHNLRTHSNYSSRQVHSAYHSTESLSFLGYRFLSKIWELVPEIQNNQKVLKSLKIKLKITFKMSL